VARRGLETDKVPSRCYGGATERQSRSKRKGEPEGAGPEGGSENRGQGPESGAIEDEPRQVDYEKLRSQLRDRRRRRQ
jgi:hypothetical protein